MTLEVGGAISVVSQWVVDLLNYRGGGENEKHLSANHRQNLVEILQYLD